MRCLVRKIHKKKKIGDAFRRQILLTNGLLQMLFFFQYFDLVLMRIVCLDRIFSLNCQIAHHIIKFDASVNSFRT